MDDQSKEIVNNIAQTRRVCRQQIQIYAGRYRHYHLHKPIIWLSNCDWLIPNHDFVVK